MSSRRKREEFDELSSRVLLFIIGAFFLVIIAAIFYREGAESQVAVAIGMILSIIGFPFLFVSILGSKKEAMKWADNTGNHELLIVFLLAALGISYVLKKIGRKT